MTVVSSAALATLTVSSPLLDKDVLLKLVSQLASASQLKVAVKKKGNELQLDLLEYASLTQRNAIVRALAGPALHHALDMNGIYLLGGYSAAARAGGSPMAGMALSSLNSWMTVASQVKSGETSPDDLLAQLEPYLLEKAFLIPSAQATLADFDVMLALLPKIDQAGPNVSRWLQTTHGQMQDLASKCDSVTVPDLTISEPPIPMPMFYYGAEEFVAARKDAAAPAAAKKAVGAVKGTPATGAAGGAGGGLSDEAKKAAAEKRAKKKAEKAKKKPAQPTPPAKSDWDITALDIRVGKVLKAWHHPEAEKLFCEEIDLGEDKPRQIASGLRPFYKTEDFADRRVLVLSNLKSRNLVGFPSHGMVLCASNADHTKVEFVSPPDGAKIGERVLFGELGDQPPEAENKVGKKKLLEKLLPDLKTNSEGIVIWKDHVSKTSSGPCRAINKMSDAQVA